MNYLGNPFSQQDLHRSDVLRDEIHGIMDSSPDGRVTYGEFARMSLYGIGAATGFYTNPTFRPNDIGSGHANTFGTMASLPGFGIGIGEILAIEMQPFEEAGLQMNLIEVGGGDGSTMSNILKGIQRMMGRSQILPDINLTMIDVTQQLLDRQRSTLGGGDGVSVHAIKSDIKDVIGPLFKTGAVVSNELLDMLPFEIAVHDSEQRRPQILYVKKSKDGLGYDFGDAPEPIAQLAHDTLKDAQKAGNHAPLRAFQPTLLEAMDRLTSLVGAGVITTIDYRIDYEPDVQVMRAGVQSFPRMELEFPGLFDISVVPDWRKIVRWARQRFGEEAVEFELLDAFLHSTPSYEGKGSSSLMEMPRAVRRNALQNSEYDSLIKELVAGYSVMLIRK